MTLSRESTITLGRGDSVHRQNLHPSHDFSPDPANAGTKHKVNEVPPGNRLIIAVDFGTTYSAVSYIPIPQGSSPEFVGPHSIRSIQNYPEDRNFNSNDQMVAEVPTEVIYPLNRHFREEEASNDMHHNATNGVENETHRNTSNPAFHLDSEHINRYDIDGDDVHTLSNPLDDQFRWGYQVHELWNLPSTHADNSNQPLSRFKLLLDSSAVTQRLRENIQHTVHKLQRQKIVSGNMSVIADFLTYLLKHVQTQLLNEGFDDGFRKEIVLCVPAIWTQQACRQMQTCMAIAMRRAEFRGVDTENNSIENLFIVSEPEAAAAYVLTNKRGLNVRGWTRYPFI